MRRSLLSIGICWTAVAASVSSVGDLALAQRPLDQARAANQNFGMDDSTFRRVFGAVLAQRAAASAPARTVEALADQVTEVRLFLTPERTMVVGEIAVAGQVSLSEITVPLEQARVTFSDRGQPPDRTRGDGVFTARFRLDADSLWQSMRRTLGASAQAFRSPDARQFVRRGPRDIVAARDAIESLRTRAPAVHAALTQGAERAAQTANARTAAEAMRLARADPTRTPFLVIPGSRVDSLTRSFRRFLDLPVLEFFPPPAPPIAIDEARSLMIVHPSVVDAPTLTFDACTSTGTEGAAWSFGHLMREMAFGTGLSPEDYTMHWLSNWVLIQEANGFIVNEPGRAVRLQNHVIASWQRLSGATLDVDKFPARLLAIVNRPDLADKIGYGVAGSAGEGRFVFGLVEKTSSGACVSLPFTVIFEFGIAGGSCSAVKAWHQRWKNLDANPIGSAPYKTALESITRDFTDHGSNPAQAPNRSSLNQLRTNENALDPTWQLREFRLQSTGAVPPGVLDLVTVKQTPDDGFRNGTAGTPTVAAYIIANEPAILANAHAVPDRFPGIFDPFVGAKSNVPFPPSSVFWNAPGLAAPPLSDPAEARRKFSLGTCNACHGGETATFFTHIGSGGMRNIGSPATLSGFLTGIDVTVPVTGGTHHYADLAEREVAMSNILTRSCFELLAVRRIPFVH